MMAWERYAPAGPRQRPEEKECAPVPLRRLTRTPVRSKNPPMADAAAEVKARLDIVEVIGGYVRLARSGRGHKGLCPFHSQRTPSLSVSQEKQAWYCFGCQEGGDVLTFVEKIEHVDFMGALEMLAERAGVEIERSHP